MKKITLHWLNNITFVSNIYTIFLKIQTEKTGIEYMAFYLPESSLHSEI